MPKDNTGTDARTGGKPGEAGLCGLIVRLEKDILWSEHYGDTPILGYFDHVELQQIHHWLQFSPRTTAVELQDGGEESPLSMYPIKLIFPEPSVVSGLEERAGLSYTSWMGNLSE